MRVKMLTTLKGPKVNGVQLEGEPGDVVDVSEDLGTELVRRGHAERSDEASPAIEDNDQDPELALASDAVGTRTGPLGRGSKSRRGQRG